MDNLNNELSEVKKHKEVLDKVVADIDKQLAQVDEELTKTEEYRRSHAPPLQSVITTAGKFSGL